MKSLIIALAITLCAISGNAQTQCKGITKAGKQCAHKATADNFCKLHNPNTTRCEGITKAGSKCKMLPSKGTKFCHLHTK